MEKENNAIQRFIILFWIFILGSVLGYIYETVLVYLQKGYFETRQGLIYGPFIPVYGIGGIIYYLVLNNIKSENKNKWKIFFITMVLGGITEYICSFIQEKVFGTISWDYSYLPFNFNGRTSLLHCIYWGIAGVIYISYIEPWIKKLQEKVDKISIRVITAILTVYILCDIAISCAAAERQYERKKAIPPKNGFDIYMDAHYPDECLDKVFTNKKEVIRK